MTSRRGMTVIGALLLLAAGGAAALYLSNRREVTTSSAAAYQAYRQGVENERRFYLKEARVAFARALELDPEFAMAMLGLARLSDREQAEGLVKRAERQRTRLTEREHLLLDLQLAGTARKQDAVLKLAREIHEKYPDDVRAAQILASDEMAKGNSDRALQIFGEVLAIDPNNASVYNLVGYHYGYRGDYEKAIENLKKYQFMAPDQANPHDSLGEIQAFSGHYEEAIVNLRRALSIKPDFFQAYEHLGVAYEGMGNYQKAIDNYLKAAENAISAEQAEGYLFLALRVALVAEDRGSAASIAARIEKLPKNEFSEFLRVYLEAGRDLLDKRPAEAERLLDEFKPKLDAVLSKPLREGLKKGWNYFMAMAKVAQDEESDAIPLYEEMANPPNGWRAFEDRLLVYEGRAHLAALLAKRGDLDRAEKLLEENRKWNPHWAPTREAELTVAEKLREKVLAAAK